MASFRLLSGGAIHANGVPLPILPLLVTSLILGCSEIGYRVSGTVTTKGEAIETGTITFRPMASSKGSQVAQTIIEDGRYSLVEPLRQGTYRVEIQARRKTGYKIPSDGDKPMIEAWEEFIPPEFNVQSKLQAEVTDDNDKLNFDLQF